MKKICSNCKIEKDLEKFHKGSSACKVCVSERQKRNYEKIKTKHYEWMKNHPEHKKYQAAYFKKYQQLPDFKEKNKSYQWKYAHTERGRIVINLKTARRRKRERDLINDITADQVLQIKESQQNKCAICHKIFNKQLPFELDHIIPVALSKPGDPGLTMGNVQLLCRSCNATKNKRSMI
ncbi:MAG: HNH endonuclease signature motif containing protein [Patescibacteria group bacterium]|jgi:5-methylcytosine-specific restriction endonuclease McrA